jgi:hypothetical protein
LPIPFLKHQLRKAHVPFVDQTDARKAGVSEAEKRDRRPRIAAVEKITDFMSQIGPWSALAV